MKIANVPFALPEGFLCPECGERRGVSCQFDGFVYCSGECAKKAMRRRYRKLYRARQYDALIVDQVDPNLVFLRDGYGCRFCHVRTPISLRGTLHPNEPTLEHLIALAIGGAHSYDNTRCCCRQCNHRRGEAVSHLVDQLNAQT